MAQTDLFPSDMGTMAVLKQQPVVATTEVHPDSEEEINAAVQPEITMDLQAKGSRHPTFIPNGTILQNITGHLACNNWFIKNVQQLADEYRKLDERCKSQAITIGSLKSQVGELKMELRNVEIERDEARADYEAELDHHHRTKAILEIVRRELRDLHHRFEHNLAELKRAKALLAEANRENARLKVKLEEKTARIKDLEEKLKISNASEDQANLRVTDLQRYIYQLEREKTAIEKQKDEAQLNLRTSKDNVQRLKEKVDCLKAQIRDLQNGRCPPSRGPIKIMDDNDVERLYGDEVAPVLAEDAVSKIPDTPAEPIMGGQEAPSTPDALYEDAPPAEEQGSPSPALSES